VPGKDRVVLDWACAAMNGRRRYKVNVCHEGGWLAEGEISYAGPRAEARARLAADVLKKRLVGLVLRVDLIGAISILGDDAWPCAGRHARRRCCATCACAWPPRMPTVARPSGWRREVTALYTCGPAGGGGVRTALTPRLNTLSCLLPRERIPVRFELHRRGGPRMTIASNTDMVPLYRAAHGRTGDKGDRSNISVIAWHADLFPLLLEQLTPERVAAQFRHRAPSQVQRFRAAQAARDELRARRGARRRRERCAEPRHARQGAVLSAAGHAHRVPRAIVPLLAGP
jgi:hypothetical protein